MLTRLVFFIAFKPFTRRYQTGIARQPFWIKAYLQSYPLRLEAVFVAHLKKKKNLCHLKDAWTALTFHKCMKYHRLIGNTVFSSLSQQGSMSQRKEKGQTPNVTLSSGPCQVCSALLCQCICTHCHLAPPHQSTVLKTSSADQQTNSTFILRDKVQPHPGAGWGGGGIHSTTEGF